MQETGQNYYANVRTNETCWELPKEAIGDDSTTYVKLRHGWFQYLDDETGRHYYYNVHTQQTVWSLPANAGRMPGEGDVSSEEEAEVEGIRPTVEDDTDDDDFDDHIPKTPSQFKANEEEAAAKAREKEEKRCVSLPPVPPPCLTSTPSPGARLEPQGNASSYRHI